MVISSYELTINLKQDAGFMIRMAGEAKEKGQLSEMHSYLRAATLLAFASIDGLLNVILLKHSESKGGLYKPKKKKSPKREKSPKKESSQEDFVGHESIMKCLREEHKYPSGLGSLLGLKNRVQYMLERRIIPEKHKDTSKDYVKKTWIYYNPLKHYALLEENISPNDLDYDIASGIVAGLEEFFDELWQVRKSLETKGA